jgi:hypothetical protein
MGIRVTGGAGIIAKLNKCEADLKKALGPALAKQAEAVLDNSSGRAPVLTGNLAYNSNKVDDPEYKGNRVTVTAGYDTKIAPYAIVQHETHRNKSKFLESAMYEEQPQIAKRVAADLRSKLGT